LQAGRKKEIHQSRMTAKAKTLISNKVPAGGGKARILIVDDHSIVREGLMRVLDGVPDLMVCAQAESAAQALEAARVSRPDLVVVDISLGGESGLELIKDFKARYPRLPVLVHSMHDETLYAERCLRAGAKGYVMKQAPTERLLLGIRQVLRQEIFLSAETTRQFLHRLAGDPTKPGGGPEERLSDRELEVFELLGQGHRTKEVAGLLHLSDKTVQTHREHIKEKLGLRDAASLVRRAVQWVEGRE
jgi:DNA-binding NarL/FixJ family response regulator